MQKKIQKKEIKPICPYAHMPLMIMIMIMLTLISFCLTARHFFFVYPSTICSLEHHVAIVYLYFIFFCHFINTLFFIYLK